MNSFQIEGEKGYIYVKSGSNRMAEVQVVTKDSEENFNEQEKPNPWFYEVRKWTELLLDENYEAVYQGLDVMVDVMEVLETARKKAGILFPGD